MNATAAPKINVTSKPSTSHTTPPIMGIKMADVWLMVTPAEILLVISAGSAVFLRYVSRAILKPKR